MNKLKRICKKLDDNFFKVLFIGYIFLIPLYPKFPLFTINFTYIAIRLEDIYFLFLSLVFLIQVLRKKLKLEITILKFFIIYWIAIFLSFIFGFYVLKTIKFFHIGLLHTLRRVEYMLPFLYAASLVKNKNDAIFYLKLFLFASFLVMLYGLGQKYFGFPAVQTMNPEYSKGRLLILTPEARISSTFAGHYDLAAYIIFLFPILLTFLFITKKQPFLISVLYLYILILTASRISFVAYLISIFPLLLYLKKYKVAITLGLITLILLLVNKSVLNRFARTFQVKKVLVNKKTGQIYIPQKIKPDELPAGSFAINIEKNKLLKKIAKDEISKKDFIEAEKKAIRDVALQIGFSTQEANLIAQNQDIELLEKKAKQNPNLKKRIEKIKPFLSKKTIDKNTEIVRNYLKPVTTILSDISFATRLQIEWPRALGAFLSSPILGFGASALTEATDNDYLRWLGEFGILGTTIFLYILIKQLFLRAYIAYKKSHQKIKLLYIGYFFGLWAIFINASYIDVFEASKVAYTFWMISGIIYSLINYETN